MGFWGLIVFLLIVGALAIWDRKINGKPVPSLHIATAEEREEAMQRDRELSILRNLPRDWSNEILAQYKAHFTEMPYDSDFVDPTYVEYFMREEALFASLSKTAQKQVLRNKNHVNDRNNYMTAWNNYCAAFAGERMLKDRNGLPHILDMHMLYWDPERMKHPFQSSIDKVWHHYWKHTHYPELISRFNKTGEFIPGWDWRPLESIPDYHTNS